MTQPDIAQPPFAALCTSLAALGTALVALASQLRTAGYEQYVESVGHAGGMMWVTAGLTAYTWYRHRQQHSG
ncbi:SCO3870 family protein [Streptomyces sp. NPDC001922]|uniref:SCO3870 family protein n=1 Tax=Streptomyces sp. NPDC001922 TaxID=3364624 RepID=UPI0036CF64FD